MNPCLVCQACERDVTEVAQKCIFALFSCDIAWNITEVWNINDGTFMMSILDKIAKEG